MHDMIRNLRIRREPPAACALRDEHNGPHRSAASVEQKREYGRRHDPERKRRAREVNGDAVRAHDRERKRRAK